MGNIGESPYKSYNSYNSYPPLKNIIFFDF